MRSAGTRAERPVLHIADALLPYTETFVQHRLRPSAHRGSLAAGWRRLDDGLEIPCPSVILPDRRKRRPSSLPARLQARLLENTDLLRVLQRNAPAVLHAHFGP